MRIELCVCTFHVFSTNTDMGWGVNKVCVGLLLNPCLEDLPWGFSHSIFRLLSEAMPSLPEALI